jgi:hypothetical protein
MKTFYQFIEQVETAQRKIELDKKRSSDYAKQQVRASMKHRTHVHGELARTATFEREHPNL